MMNDNASSLIDLFDALVFAAEKHQYQRRDGYERLPYLNHLLKVADALARVGREFDKDLLIAALLHDIVEDTGVSARYLAERFGEKVAGIVAELSDDMQLPYTVRKQRQVEGARRLSFEARKIRIADKACNIRDLTRYPIDWPKEKKLAYVENAVAIVDQIRGVNVLLEAWFDEAVREAITVFGVAP
jgi:guanosine-3',5'-bis(diphosphate) 3'-pyrophosphohydrolase